MNGTHHLLGVDTGGTFTDFVLLDHASGAISTFKLPSRPAEPAAPLADGLARLAARDVPAQSLDRIVFGTTVATNALLERTGAECVLVTTRGARDVLEIQRQWRHRLFDLELQRPEPLVSRRRRLEVDERVGADGTVVTPLGAAEVERVAAAVAALAPEAVAICLLFSFLAPEHEQRLRDAIAARLPGVPVSVSSDVCPEFREYERTCTTVMNAYVAPKVARLMRRLDGIVAEADCAAPLRIIQSNGGLMSSTRAAGHAVNTLLSGPAGGVVGAAAVARAAGLPDVVTIDMGGTSLDIAVVQGGAVKLFPDGSYAGFPVKVPQVDVHTIGAGGGSIARVHRGALIVGPRSAGAEPGPVCYGRGGTEPTSTDCALVAGFIDPGYFAGGDIVLDADAARAAVHEAIAAPLGFDTVDAALAVIEVQVANMVAGIRTMTVERGLDPRDFALLPFGGAGGLYAGLIAEALGMRRILAPVHAGVLSALGMLMTDVRAAHSTTRLLPATAAAAAEAQAVFEALERRALDELAGDGVAADHVKLARTVDLRYVGQAYEVDVPVPAGPADPVALAAAFHAEHARRYGSSSPGDAVEMVAFRVVGTGDTPRATLARLAPAAGPPVPKSRRAVHFRRGAGPVDCAILERATLGAGATFDGPAVVEEPGATTVVFPGQRVRVDDFGNLHIEATT